MNNLLFSLAMAALGQFTGLGGGGFWGGPPGGIAIAPRPYGTNPYGSQPLNPGSSSPTPAMQLASVTAARCLEQSDQLAPGESDTLLRNQGRARGWPNGWQQGISDSQSERLLSRYGGCDGLLAALRQGRFTQGQNGLTRYGSGINSGGLISQQPFRGAPPQGQPNSEAEAFGLAPYR